MQSVFNTLTLGMLAVARLFAQEHPPMILEIYRDPVKPGSETAFKAIEQDAARRCVELRCPHPHRDTIR